MRERLAAPRNITHFVKDSHPVFSLLPRSGVYVFYELVSQLEITWNSSSTSVGQWIHSDIIGMHARALITRNKRLAFLHIFSLRGFK
jgi:hypothetical protein